jgi:hypothetical protein
VFKTGQTVETTTPGLRLRKKPGLGSGSVIYHPLLPLGTRAYVIGGPATASGYSWYKVVPVLVSGLGPGYGWVAAADLQGDAWLSRVRGPEVIRAGTGTAVIDGVIGDGEWTSAWRPTFTMAAPPEADGVEIKVRMMVMTDRLNLYLALVVPGTYDAVSTGWEFDADNDRDHYEDGEDVIVVNAHDGQATLTDDFRYHCPGSDVPGGCGPSDISEFNGVPAGTSDGVAVAGEADGVTVIEIARPLASGDVLHDIQLRPYDLFGLHLELSLWGCGADRCVTNSWYPGTMAQILALPD